MPQPAARMGDNQVGPRGPGPIVMGYPKVLIGGLPAARMGDPVATALGPDALVMGCPKVLIGNMPAARMGDPTAGGGAMVIGKPNVLIG